MGNGRKRKEQRVRAAAHVTSNEEKIHLPGRNYCGFFVAPSEFTRLAFDRRFVGEQLPARGVNRLYDVLTESLSRSFT